jgi:hypothetical protein
MCSSLDYIDNEIKHGSLKMKYLIYANIPHSKAIRREPVDHLEEILEDHYPVDILIKCFQVQAFYPTQVSTNISHLMTTLKMHSKWISNNKKTFCRENYV